MIDHVRDRIGFEHVNCHRNWNTSMDQRLNALAFHGLCALRDYYDGLPTCSMNGPGLECETQLQQSWLCHGLGQ